MMGQRAQWAHRDAIHDRATSAVVDPAQLFLDDLGADWTTAVGQRGDRQ
jgi:hypothetical protein